MPALTREDIANLALDLLTEGSIDSLEEDTKPARLLKRQFEITREAELTKNAWSFAIMSKDIDAADTNSQAWPFVYEMPSDALRILPPVDDFQNEIDWRIEGSNIYARNGGSLNVRYIANLIDPNDWPSVFTDVYVAALAMKVAHGITGKASMIEVARQAYKDALTQAVRLNAVQTRGRATAGLWEHSRGSFFSPWGYSRTRHGGGWR